MKIIIILMWGRHPTLSSYRCIANCAVITFEMATRFIIYYVPYMSEPVFWALHYFPDLLIQSYANIMWFVLHSILTFSKLSRSQCLTFLSFGGLFLDI